MNLILDTHILIYIMRFPSQLSNHELEIINNRENNLNFSAISIWEISVKYNLGRLNILNGTPLEFCEYCFEAGLKLKNIELEELSSLYQLPFNSDHKDPFDRMLIWQCIKNDFTLMSRDKKFETYKDFGLKIFK